MKGATSLIAVFGLALTVGGCATIVGGGSNQVIQLQGTPSGAQYTILSSSGLQMANGGIPASVRLPRKNEYQIQVSMEGYQSQTVAVTKSVNGWIFGNLIIGWIVGFAIDFITGSAYKLEPSLVTVALQQAEELTAVLQFFDEDGEVIRTERLEMLPVGH